MEKYSVTPESRGEDLNSWSDTELTTLHSRLVAETADNDRIMGAIENILEQRHGVERNADDEAQLPQELYGERVELPPFMD